MIEQFDWLRTVRNDRTVRSTSNCSKWSDSSIDFELFDHFEIFDHVEQFDRLRTVRNNRTVRVNISAITSEISDATDTVLSCILNEESFSEENDVAKSQRKNSWILQSGTLRWRRARAYGFFDRQAWNNIRYHLEIILIKYRNICYRVHIITTFSVWNVSILLSNFIQLLNINNFNVFFH